MSKVQELCSARGYILCFGRKLYHIYKHPFPMEFWYSIDPDDVGEGSLAGIDVRTMPEKYRGDRAIEVRWTDVPKRSFNKRHREQLAAHAMVFAAALVDGYSLEDHIARERQRYEAESLARRATVLAADDDDFPF